MIKKIFKWLGLFLFTLIAGLFVYNLILQTKYKDAYEEPVLSVAENNEMNFIYKLKENEGENIWPGFSSEEIPLIFFNNKYEFLYNFDPQNSGWTKIKPAEKNAPVVFRREALNPQAFAVDVENTWVASIGTREHMNRDLFLGIRKEVPTLFSKIFPFFIFKVSPGTHISGTVHEMFHALEAKQNEQKFLSAEATHAALEDYPYNDDQFSAYWNTEGQLLAKALDAENEKQFAAYVDSFLLVRNQRRESLNEKHIDAERGLEWLEGLAKYVEYRSYILSAENDPEEFNFKTKNAYWQMEQKDRLKRMGKHSGDNRFYHSGAAMAFILDKLNPNWKHEIMQDDVYLEDLVEKYHRNS